MSIFNLNWQVKNMTKFRKNSILLFLLEFILAKNAQDDADKQRNGQIIVNFYLVFKHFGSSGGKTSQDSGIGKVENRFIKHID